MVNMKEKVSFALSMLRGSQEVLLQSLKDLSIQATDGDLKDAIDEHTKVTEQQISDIDKIFTNLGEYPTVTQSQAAQGLSKDALILVNGSATPELKDCAIADAVIKAEAFEAACQEALSEALIAADENEGSQLLSEAAQVNDEMKARTLQILTEIL